ncbi:hypothetical protein [Actinacidiphila acidipaludis]|uniref:DUF1049 domain-containing protein n=1 Tax=Actinacidiphila acidipaludis TaxID=2873382 RepID=A0ABS7QB91_9ACTN|nr:hypothetical protein [Streptomyces acidipaludis]MBY8880403.1 hypothetical protein [Streptomyces acidipaludis]
MRRHRFEPAALVMGLVLIGLTVAFVLDACRVWDLSRLTVTIPLAGGGLLLVAATAILTQGVRFVRARRERRRQRAGAAPGSARPGAW